MRTVIIAKPSTGVNITVHAMRDNERTACGRPIPGNAYTRPANVRQLPITCPRCNKQGGN